MKHFLSAFLAAVLAGGSLLAQKGPVMGWSSWNTYRVHISDTLIMRQADALVRTGLKDAGYTYINIDDGFFGYRDARGKMQPHPQRFPGGMKRVADHIHSLGLKAGIYSDAGAVTCGSIWDKDKNGIGAGLYGHEEQDARLYFRHWGYDFIKIDYCGAGQELDLDERERYTAIRRAIDKVGRTDVEINICRWAFPGTWARDVATSWRISEDIRDSWGSVKHIIEKCLPLSAYCSGGHYNDMDMLEIGRSLSEAEERTHFGLWCILSSPLLIGCDLTTIPARSLALLKNEELIALNQDTLHLQAYPVQAREGTYVLVKDIVQRRGTVRAVALYNPTDSARRIAIAARELELEGTLRRRDLFARKNLKAVRDSITALVPPHDVVILRVEADRRIEPTRYEAEWAYLPLYNDLGKRKKEILYAPCAEASGGMVVRYGGGSPENAIQWNHVYSAQGGMYALTIHYLPAENRGMEVRVNGATVVAAQPKTEGGMAALTVPIRLNAGENRIELTCPTAWMPDIDKIEVRKTPVALAHLTVEGRENPMGIDVAVPRLGWQILSDVQNVVQTGYRIQVSSTPDGNGDVWDSGEVNSAESQWIALQEITMKPNKDYYWRVNVRTNAGETGWSEAARWTTGLLDDANWQGEWIGTDSLWEHDTDRQHSRCTGRYLRKEFAIDKEVRRATVHVSGLGYYALYMNGRRVGNDWLTPAPTDFTRTVAYNTYDVTQMLSRRNAIGALVEAGYYFAPAQNFQSNVRTTYGTPRLRLNLILEYADGSSETIVTDRSWKLHADGAVRFANLYDGECYDSRKEPDGWTLPGYNDTAWAQAEVVKAPGGTMRGNITTPIRVYETGKPVSIKKIGSRYLLDFGTNGAGVLRLKLKAEEGDTVRIRHAELLNEAGTGLYVDNLRTAEATAYYIGNGEEATWMPEFTWYGFRYAEITGLDELDAEDVERLLLSDDLSAEGNSLRIAGNETLNKIVEAAYRGIRSNYKGMPMDCPQRDERMPWLGDRTTGCLGESFMLDVHPLYNKWLRDICECQREDGALSDVAPAYWRLYNTNITWPAALPFGCEMMFRQYGDVRPLRDSYPVIDKWLRYVRSKSYADGLITYDRYGDWCVPPEGLDVVLTKDSTRMTDGRLISSCYYYYLCGQMSRYAGMQHLSDDADYYQKEAATTREAINRTFLRGDTYGNSTVTANLMPLAMGIVPDNREKAVRQTLLQTIEKNGYKQSCGVIGIQWLMRYLSSIGRGDIAYRMASTDEYPSWGYMIKNGATTIWELWNGNTANPSMNSGNHVMLLGDLLPWCYECLGGIKSGAPGFKHVLMAPNFSIDSLQGVSASHRSPYGVITSCWKRTDTGIVWDVELPANTTATVRLPDGETRQVGSGKWHWEQ